ncbi:secondary thiamine-phosphate synthase enzyme YjbQ [Halobacteriaceae archaeon SHR40]|uniref:secondary thiamine-phosphate synthase enzyme YjbQ n=1 Tax=Halovenus amylolytica TaxID=2500550 RepID=UPI000FE32094
METFDVSTSERLSVFDITDRVEEQIPTDATGTVTVFVQHTTAGITVNEAESRLLSDFESALDELVADSGWQHDQIDDNADSHIRSLLVGPGTTIPVVDGSLQLGTWQSVLFVECDGPRERTVQVVFE